MSTTKKVKLRMGMHNRITRDRWQAIKDDLNNGLPVQKVAKRHSVSDSTVRKVRRSRSFNEYRIDAEALRNRRNNIVVVAPKSGIPFEDFGTRPIFPPKCLRLKVLRQIIEWPRSRTIGEKLWDCRTGHYRNCDSCLDCDSDCRRNKMSKNYKVVYRMAGGTVVFMKEFVNPSAVLYCLTQNVYPDATTVTVEDLESDMMATHDIKNGRPSTSSIEGVKAFLGVV